MFSSLQKVQQKLQKQLKNNHEEELPLNKRFGGSFFEPCEMSLVENLSFEKSYMHILWESGKNMVNTRKEKYA